MSLTKRWSLVVLVSLSAACVAESKDEEQATNAAPIVAGACSQEHFIYESPTGACPTIPAGPTGSFEKSTMFSAPGLASFCAYDWVPLVPGSAPGVADLKTLPLGADPDCNVVGALASSPADSPELMTPLHDETLKQAGAVPLPAKTGIAPVRVSVIDTSPASLTGKAVPGRSPHGLAVERVIRELSCPSDGTDTTPCVGQIESRLGLPQIDATHSDKTLGGYFGSQGQLARAIADAVDAWSWRRRYTRNEPTRLVINLSVGWDAGRGYETVTTAGGTRASHPTNAVVAALRHASCKGAITIAAAGNRTGTPETSGPMYPAGFEVIPAPSKTMCEAIEGAEYWEERVNPIFPKEGVYRPLVWAVSGVDATDRPLVNARSKGIARLTAYGDEVVATYGTGFTRNLTGSSMSTAIVSATAATVWGYAPTLTPADVMALLYDRGVDLTKGAPADIVEKTPSFCTGGMCTTMSIKRVSLGASLAAACAGGACNVVPVTTPAYAGMASTWPGGWSGIDPSLKTATSIDACANGACSLPYEKELTQGATPWVGPQPGKVGCDVCGLTQAGTLFLIIGPAYTNSTATLKVDTTSGTQFYAVTPTSTSQSYQLGGVTPGSIKSAALSFDLQTYATQEPLIVMK